MPPPLPALSAAIVGAGPSGFYVAKYLAKKMPHAHISMFNALPTPHGLVRAGVAPDHLDVKLVQNDFVKFAAETRNFSYLGNVEVGRDISVHELQSTFHAVVLATGATDERVLNVPGESELRGIYAAHSFVSWYNGHPATAAADFPFEAAESCVVIGHGNVAIDVARMLAHSPHALRATDAPSHVVHALSATRSHRRSIWLVGRRGPAQATWTTKELRELSTQVPSARVCVAPRDLELNVASTAEINADRTKKRKHELLASSTGVLHAEYAFASSVDGNGGDTSTLRPELCGAAASASDQTPVRLAFHWRPHAFLEDPARPGWVGGVELRRQRLVPAAPGSSTQVAVDVVAGDTEHGIVAELPTRCILPAHLVLRSIGYRARAIPGVPFDVRLAVVPSHGSRVVASSATDSRIEKGLYVAGWARRGAVGIIGSNIADAHEAVGAIDDDWRHSRLLVRVACRPFSVISFMSFFLLLQSPGSTFARSFSSFPCTTDSRHTCRRSSSPRSLAADDARCCHVRLGWRTSHRRRRAAQGACDRQGEGKNPDSC